MKKIPVKFTYIALPLILLMDFIPRLLYRLTPIGYHDLEVWLEKYMYIFDTPSYYINYPVICIPLFIASLICLWLYFSCVERRKCDQKIMIYALIRPLIMLILLFFDYNLRVVVYDVMGDTALSVVGLSTLGRQIFVSHMYLSHITYLPFIWFAIENRVRTILKTTA